MEASDDPSLVVQRRLLGYELREARKDAGHTQEHVAAAMGWSRSKIARIETGKVGISIDDLKALCHHYDTADAIRIDELISLVKEMRSGKTGSQYQGQGRRTATGPASLLPESRWARAPESELDLKDRQGDRVTADDNSLNRYIRWHKYQVMCQWQRIAQYLVFFAGLLALILAFLDLVKGFKLLPAQAAYLTISGVISGFGGYTLRRRLSGYMERRPRDHEADEPLYRIKMSLPGLTCGFR
jgi:transcriptional regulator with XRE-family HTH domain